MTGAPAPEGGALPRLGSSPARVAAANGVDRRPSHGDSPQKEGKGGQEEGDCPRVQRWEVWGLSLGMEDFHAAWPSDLL